MKRIHAVGLIVADVERVAGPDRGGCDHRYTAERYHKPADEFDPSWDFEGAVLDAETLIRVVLEVANAEEWPDWMPGTEFKAVRDAMLNR